MFSEPIHLHDDVYALVLDSQGLHAPDISAQYDAKIFSMAVLLSSQVLFNIWHQVDQLSFENIETMGHTAKLFSLRNAVSNGETPTVDFPSLHLVVRDSYLGFGKHKSCLQWVENELLPAKRRDSDAGEHLPPTLDSVRELFPQIDCTTLGFPAKSEHIAQLDKSGDELFPEFKAQVASMLDKVKRSPSKRVGGEYATGESLALLLRTLVSGANKQEGEIFPLIPSAMASYIKSLISGASDAALSQFHADSGALGLLLERECKKILTAEKSKVLVKWAENLKGLRSLETPKREIEDRLDDALAVLTKRNDERLQLNLRNIADTVWGDTQKLVKRFKLPLASSVLKTKEAAIAKAARANFTEVVGKFRESPKFAPLRDDLASRLSDKMMAILGENRDLIEAILVGEQNKSLAALKKCIHRFDPPAKESVFNDEMKQCGAASQNQFEEGTSAWSGETFYSRFVTEFKGLLQEAISKRTQKYATQVNAFAESTSAQLIPYVTEWERMDLPVTDEEIEESFGRLTESIRSKFFAKLEGYNPKHFNAAWHKLGETTRNAKSNVDRRNVEITEKTISPFLNELRGEIAPLASEFWLVSSFESFVVAKAERKLKTAVPSKNLRRRVIARWLKDLNQERSVVTSWHLKVALLVIVTIGIVLSLWFRGSTQSKPKIE